MKTALTRLLERIEATINNDYANDFGRGQAIGLKLVIDSIKNEWLECEKHQIIEAYKAGFVDSQKPSKDLKKEFNDYYTDNFH